MRHHDHRAGKIVDRFGERRAAVDIEMVGRLVENDHVRTMEGREPEQQPRLLTTRQAFHQRIGRLSGKADRAGTRAHFALRGIGHQPAYVIVRRAVFVQFIQLVLREVSDRQLVGARHRARERLQPVGEQLDQRRFAVAIGAEQRDAIIMIDAQRHLGEHRGGRVIADRDIVERDDRRRQHLFRRRERNLLHVLGHQRRDRLHLFQHFDARLRLPGLGGLGFEAIDKILQPLAFRFLALDLLGVEQFAAGALLLER